MWGDKEEEEKKEEEEEEEEEVTELGYHNRASTPIYCIL